MRIARAPGKAAKVAGLVWLSLRQIKSPPSWFRQAQHEEFPTPSLSEHEGNRRFASRPRPSLRGV